MRIFKTLKSISNYTKNSVLVIGNFDGVHKGHQKIIQSAKKIASKNNSAVGVILFDPHPKTFFNKNKKNFLLTNIENRYEILKSYGVDYVVVVRFSSNLSRMSPSNFCKKILSSGIKMNHVLVGKNFRFGNRRIGDYKFLKNFGVKNNFNVSPIDIFKLPKSYLAYVKKNAYSSSNIRRLINNGHIKLASRFLGRPWFIQGKVIKGDKRGRTIGIPTANISLDGYIFPKYGVYAVNAQIIKKKQSGKLLKGIANFGIRPTFNKKKAILEVYLFDFDLNIYQSTLKVTFIDFIRKEKKFSGIKSLKLQLNKDISKATRILI